MVAGRRLNPDASSSSSPPPAAAGGIATLRALPEVFQYTRHALGLVWSTSRPLTVALATLTLVAGVLPAGIAFIGALIVDAVVAAIAAHDATGAVDLSTVLSYVVLEGLLVAALAAPSAGSRPASRCCAPSSASASTR
jgi:ATP-binding cassette, subfamily B, bacterial